MAGATVYSIRGLPTGRPYVGLTRRAARVRLREHDRGIVNATRPYCPWTLVVAFYFPDLPTARRFERYLKSGSGRAFAKRHF